MILFGAKPAPGQQEGAPRRVAICKVHPQWVFIKDFGPGTAPGARPSGEHNPCGDSARHVMSWGTGPRPWSGSRGPTSRAGVSGEGSLSTCGQGFLLITWLRPERGHPQPPPPGPSPGNPLQTPGSAPLAAERHSAWAPASLLWLLTRPQDRRWRLHCTCVPSHCGHGHFQDEKQADPRAGAELSAGWAPRPEGGEV